MNKQKQDENMIFFGNRLRYLRQINGMRVQDVSKKIGISCESLYRYEEGKNAPPMHIAEKIANVYGYTINFVKKED